MRARRPAVAFLSFLLLPAVPPALGEHVSLWVGGGAGSFLAGAASDVEGHKFGVLAVGIAGDRLRLRYLRGSFEREKDVSPGVGDADVDYEGADVVFTRRLTGLPVDLSIGGNRFKEARLRPGSEGARRVFDRRWGPHLSFLRDFPLWKPIRVWTELDVDSARFRSRQIFAFFDAGVGFHF
ncbi:MAG TPA: hypothetical protein VGS98_13610 [Thermoanaerobaculia bacterium]|jgi:hypothetical protein|nr:hypothetical protein [Thermoanaerobaculia bacterium]